MPIQTLLNSKTLLCLLFSVLLLGSLEVFSQEGGARLAQTEETNQPSGQHAENEKSVSDSDNVETTSDSRTWLILAIIFLVICVVIFLVLREESHTC
ncbi:hypothetical protein BKI52_06285 [marine bacterium AO1-C]|nr:hypothetical protein BKI52_06285 [marine bacterium AO1-C]